MVRQNFPKFVEGAVLNNGLANDDWFEDGLVRNDVPVDAAGLVQDVEVAEGFQNEL
eukprot:TRINITY_DN14830_c0_g1_i1.p2 TRINITY_DN14830_c0_g1~~TRINITY_DN14830_c0_g1_i1.p2  ORF type:complete len:56 (-),score=5.97 TRINITY_DN14830_c0_g1_i1:167-334(-)